MSSSLPPSTPPRGSMASYLDAMDVATPLSPRSQARQDGPEEDDLVEPDNELPPTLSVGGARKRPLGGNEIASTERFVRGKRLRTEQYDDCLGLLRESSPVRDSKIMALLYASINYHEAAAPNKARFEVSTDLKENLKTYGKAMFLSPKLRSYLGKDLVTMLLNLAIKLGFIHANVIKDRASTKHIEQVIGEIFTQLRGSAKKQIIASHQPDPTTKKYAPVADHQNVYELATIFVKKTNCVVTIELCARIALMRSIHANSPGDNFWHEVDKALSTIRKRADGDAKRLAKVFAAILTHDRVVHGVNDYEIPEPMLDPLQRQVEDVVEAAVADRATTVVAAADEHGGADNLRTPGA
ncbi:hypothetical protein C8F01DRAFT_1282336 [Mycena amicta]|nr:hypothetical protein C8F01DRAFT_1282336 [Mycena amicta]